MERILKQIHGSIIDLQPKQDVLGLMTVRNKRRHLLIRVFIYEGRPGAARQSLTQVARLLSCPPRQQTMKKIRTHPPKSLCQ